MGSLFCQNYKYASEDEIDIEEFLVNDKDYTPRIEGTELVIGIKLFSSKYFPVLTKRLVDGFDKYYLFDYIKVWQHFDCNPKYLCLADWLNDKELIQNITGDDNE